MKITKELNEKSIVYQALESLIKVAQVPTGSGTSFGGTPIEDTTSTPPATPAPVEPSAEPKPEGNNIGVTLAQRLTSALTDVNTADYKTRSEAIYSELSAIASELHEGDWISFPDGTTFTMTFKPKAGGA
jgi:hypothetical protein